MDIEIRKIHAILRILDSLEPPVRVRILDYLRARSCSEMHGRDLMTSLLPVTNPEGSCAEHS